MSTHPKSAASPLSTGPIQPSAPLSYFQASPSPVSPLEARLVAHTDTKKSRTSHTLAIATLLIIGCLNTLDASSAALSLPHIAETLNASNSIQWAATSYCIGLAVTTILLGRCGDAFGRKYVLTLGLTLMAISHLGAATLNYPVAFFICRGIAGMSSACIHSMTILMIGDLVTVQNRAKIQACLGCALGVGDCIGPLLISAYLQGPGWVWFYVTTTPILLTTAVISVILLPHTKVGITKKQLFQNMDYGGAICITTFLVCLVLPLMNAGISWKWSDPQTVTLLIVAALAMASFIVVEIRWIQIPIIPMRLLRTRGTLYTLCENFIIGFIFQPMQLYIPLYFTVVKGIRPDTVALMTLAWVIPLCMSSLMAGYTVTKYGYKFSIRLGLILWLVGLLCLAELFGIHSSNVTDGLILALTGSGIGFVLQPSVIAVQAQSLKADRSVAVTTRNVFKSIGGTLGISISSLIYLNAVQSSVMVSEQLVEETKDFVLQNIHSKKLSSQLGTHEGEIIGVLYTSLLLYLFFVWSNVLSLSLVFFVSPLEDNGMESVDEYVDYGQQQENNPMNPAPNSGAESYGGGGGSGPATHESGIPMRDLGVRSGDPEEYSFTPVFLSNVKSFMYEDDVSV